MAIRPSYKLEPSNKHGLIEVERVTEGIDIDLHDAGQMDDEPVTIALSIDEATELAAILRAVLGVATPEELDTLTEAQRGEQPMTALGQSLLDAHRRSSQAPVAHGPN